MRDQEVIAAADERGVAMVFSRRAPLPALIRCRATRQGPPTAAGHPKKRPGPLFLMILADSQLSNALFAISL
jgi:hypothetical protein